MFWDVVTGAVIMLIGMLFGYGLSTNSKNDGFKMLLAEIEKLKGEGARPPLRRLECPHCDHASLGRDLARADEELNHHIRTRHSGLLPSSEKPIREMPTNG